MSARQFLISMVFKADPAEAKAAAKEVKDGLAAVATEADKGAVALKGNADALDREAAAAKAAATAARELAKAEAEAREAVLKAQGVAPKPVTLAPGEVEKLRDQYVPLHAAQRTYAKELEAVAMAERAGALTAGESAVARARLKAGLEAETAAVQRAAGAHGQHGAAMKLSAHDARVLAMQYNDVIQSIMLGMPLTQVALQQGPQITQQLGGVGNTLRYVSQFLTVGRLAAAGVTVALLAGASAWNGYLKSTKEVDVAAAGLGRGMASTRQEMEASARAGAEAAGISVKAARSMEAAFLRTGRIDAGNFEGIIGLSKDFAATIGMESEAAGAALSQIFADPAKGADILYRQYGLISAATAQLAKDLAAQNRKSEAQAVLMNALPGQLADAEAATTALGRAWERVATWATNAGDAIGGAVNRVFDGPSPDELIAAQRARVDNSDDYTPYGLVQRVTGGKNAELDALAELVLQKRREGEKAARQRAIAADNLRTAQTIGVAESSPANRTAMRERELRNQIAALQSVQGASGLSDEQRQMTVDAIEAKSRALAALVDKTGQQNALDQLSVQIANERNPLRKAELILQQTFLGLADKELSLTDATAEAQRARNNVMLAAMGAAKAQSADLQTELEIRTKLDAQVASGVITREDANRLLREEIELQPLVAAAAAAVGDEQIELNQIIAARLELSRKLAEEDKRAKAQDFVRAQGEDLAKLRLELSLVGATKSERVRALAMAEAERKIRELGPTADAAGIRENASAAADLTLQIEKLQGAWDKVRSSAEAAIDGPIDAMLNGDFEGALQSLQKEVTGLFADLAIKNPLKNALIGTNLGTLQDIGGMQGIWAQLFGGAAPDSSALSASAMSYSTGSMMVSAGTVTISGAANLNGMPGVATLPNGGLAGSGDVQSQVWQYFAGKGLAPHQIAGIMGNVSAESTFDPLAVGDSGKAFGLFQHNDRAPALFGAIGGQGNLGNVQAQLDFAWNELLTTENGPLKKLLAATNVKDATAAFAGFERPRGWTAANPMGADRFDERWGAAEAAMAKFGTTTQTATANLGTLGNGFDIFGSALSQIGGGGSGGNILTTLLTTVAQGFGLPGFEIGGFTGGSNPTEVRGLVHGGEFVFNAAATARIGVSTLEAMQAGKVRGFAGGGYVVAGTAPVQQMGGTVVQFAPVFTPVNNSSVPLKMEVQESTDARGQRQYALMMSDAVATGISAKGGKADKAMRAKYGVSPKAIQR